MSNAICPMCPRGCSLSAPSCGRGRNYAQSQGLVTSESSEKHEQHAPKGFICFEDESQQKVMKYLHHAIRAADEWGLSQKQAQEMFSVLTPEETEQLAGLLEKLSSHWMHIAPNKPERSSHHHHH